MKKKKGEGETERGGRRGVKKRREKRCRCRCKREDKHSGNVHKPTTNRFSKSLDLENRT